MPSGHRGVRVYISMFAISPAHQLINQRSAAALAYLCLCLAVVHSLCCTATAKEEPPPQASKYIPSDSQAALSFPGDSYPPPLPRVYRSTLALLLRQQPQVPLDQCMFIVNRGNPAGYAGRRLNENPGYGLSSRTIVTMVLVFVLFLAVVISFAIIGTRHTSQRSSRVPRRLSPTSRMNLPSHAPRNATMQQTEHQQTLIAWLVTLAATATTHQPRLRDTEGGTLDMETASHISRGLSVESDATAVEDPGPEAFGPSTVRVPAQAHLP
ncbi:uncharacterized protein LAESUDRAFT_170253 [Laetiporus sulphureus 93-53]|uniref:Uncharacterized protein n=1 Tax=Laetiporus sulphureus 93-53 TaxID=1314785 RepID=A0A165HU44_9APHY|nr:uncharacterized protein LAESUDRAFT_170253 [Laetiporus sulphureus 93-53]KZT12188.1 hypothetical protein LAESUDRAFT_170253 [Laetiporus sulphureus 93-53]